MTRYACRVGLLVVVGITLLTGSSAMALHAGEGSELAIVDGTNFTLSARLMIGMLSGEAREIVYEGSHKLSELIWDLSGLVWGGATVSGQFGDRFRVNAGFWTALTEGDGGMEDYDWLDTWRDDWTHWSESEVDVINAWSADVNASYLVWTTRDLGVHAIVGYKHDFWEWSDFGGRYVYSSDTGFRDIIGNFGGENGIDYEQTFDIPYLGIGLTSMGHERWRASGYLLFSPLVFGEDCGAPRSAVGVVSL